MNVATLARAWFDHHDFSTLPPSGDGSYDPQRPLRLYSLNGAFNDYPEASVSVVRADASGRSLNEKVAAAIAKKT